MKSIKKSTKINKHMSFPSPIVEVLEKEGEKLGYSFTEFAVYILTKKAEEYNETYDVFTDREQDDFLKSLQEYKEGKYTVLKSAKDIKDHFDDL